MDLMDQTLADLQEVKMFVYIDDIMVYASSLREHEIKITKLVLSDSNLTLTNANSFGMKFAYLEHVIDGAPSSQ